MKIFFLKNGSGFIIDDKIKIQYIKIESIQSLYNKNKKILLEITMIDDKIVIECDNFFYNLIINLTAKFFSNKLGIKYESSFIQSKMGQELVHYSNNKNKFEPTAMIDCERINGNEIDAGILCTTPYNLYFVSDNITIKITYHIIENLYYNINCLFLEYYCNKRKYVKIFKCNKQDALIFLQNYQKNENKNKKISKEKEEEKKKKKIIISKADNKSYLADGFYIGAEKFILEEFNKNFGVDKDNNYEIFEILLTNSITENYLEMNLKLLKHITVTGISEYKRSHIWCILTNMKEKKYRYPLDYFKKLTDIDSSVEQEIDKDLGRSLPKHELFKKNGKGIPRLRRVLIALACHNKNIGYCQGINLIACRILLYCDDETTFWLMSIILEDICRGFHDENITGTSIEMDIVEEYLKKENPKVYNHIYKSGYTIATLIARDIPSLFNNMPIQYAIRVIDLLFIYGINIIPHIIINKFHIRQELLLKSDDLLVFSEIISGNFIKDQSKTEAENILQNSEDLLYHIVHTNVTDFTLERINITIKKFRENLYQSLFKIYHNNLLEDSSILLELNQKEYNLVKYFLTFTTLLNTNTTSNNILSINSSNSINKEDDLIFEITDDNIDIIFDIFYSDFKHHDLLLKYKSRITSILKYLLIHKKKCNFLNLVKVIVYLKQNQKFLLAFCYLIWNNLKKNSLLKTCKRFLKNESKSESVLLSIFKSYYIKREDLASFMIFFAKFTKKYTNYDKIFVADDINLESILNNFLKIIT